MTQTCQCRDLKRPCPEHIQCQAKTSTFNNHLSARRTLRGKGSKGIGQRSDGSAQAQESTRGATETSERHICHRNSLTQPNTHEHGSAMKASMTCPRKRTTTHTAQPRRRATHMARPQRRAKLKGTTWLNHEGERHHEHGSAKKASDEMVMDQATRMRINHDRRKRTNQPTTTAETQDDVLTARRAVVST